MISLYLEQLHKKYLEVVIDETGYISFMNNILHIKEDKSIMIDLSDKKNIKSGYERIRFLYLTLLPVPHISNTDYNIECLIKDKNTIEMRMSTAGIDELRNILNYIHKEKDHFHLFGGFDLYTGENDTRNADYINAISIYMEQTILSYGD